MASRLAYLLCLLFAACALAAKPLGHQVCVASCYYSLLKVSYSGKNATDQAACTNPLRVSSTYLCVKENCHEVDIGPGIKWWAGACKKSQKVVNLDAYHKTTDNATVEYISTLPTVGLKSKTPLNTTAVPIKTTWEQVHRSLHTYDALRTYNLDIRWVVYGFWGLVVLLGTITHAWSFISLKRSSQPASNAEVSAGPKKGGLKSWLNANIFMAPTFNYHHHQTLGWFTIPLRFQSVVIAAYFVMHVIVLATHYTVFENNYYYKTNKGQVLRYLSDRLGHLMSASMPFVFLFGGRGNLLLFATGWSYRTFNIFHRWVSIILTIEGIIHGVAFSAYYVTEQGWEVYRENLKDDEIFWYGIIMLIAMGFAIFMALGPIRQRVYDFFKAAHIIFAAIFVAAYYQHVKTQFSGYYKVWAWASIGLWAGDYFLRLVRLLFMNYKSLLGQGIPALASYSEETGMIRLQVQPSMTTYKQTPGTYYYLYFPGWRIWESHPFTLAGRSVEVEELSSASDQSDRENDGEKRVQSPRVTEFSTQKGASYLTFMIRPRDGMTRRLRDSLLQEGASGQRRIRVLLEGPYGTPARFNNFDNVLFITGGSGVTTVLPYLRMFFEDGYNGGNVPNTKLAWVVRDEGFVRDVLANDLRRTESASSASSKLSMDFFVTTGGSQDSGNEKYIKDTRFKYERPDIESLVDNFVTRNHGRKAVFVCGPADMADQTRLAVIKQVKKGYSDVELFEEMFCW
ncbi:Ferric/cupric reductase transmembrane component B-like protein [Cladobotryum mycophilum]|uniref:Ferric/cupric reductase transmembrane component B-like protein n=1 Tax=Cladobotryum mycophilum TaxID=491253 RepID=A0ABR0SUH0_9HYPO